MRKITYLLSLFLMMVGTAMAEVIKSPTSTLLTTDELNAATTDVVLAIKCISATNSYWFCGNKSVNSTNNQEIIWVWEPTGDGTTHYLKKYAPTNAQGEGYLQATTYGIGAKASAQKFVATNATLPGSTDTPVVGTNTENGYIVRFAWENGTKWVNVQAPTGNPTYNTGAGLYTMYNVYATEDLDINLPVTDLANLSNTKAYTLRTRRSDLVAKSDGSRIATTNDIRGTFDKTNAQYQFALLKNTSGSYFLYSISANKFVNKTGNLVNYAEPILFKNGDTAGTFVLYFDASHYINMGGSNQLSIDNWSTADEGNSYTITQVAEFFPSEELLNSIEPRVVTVNYNVDEKTYSTANKSFYLNSPVTAEKFTTDLNGTYLAFGSTDVGTVTAETTEINVTCTAQTPFVVSESYNNATWYLIDMHSNDTGAGDVLSGAKNYLWTATTDANAYTTAEVTLPKYDTKQSATFSDNMLWCFVGDVVDGFVIYNKAAGSEYALAKPATGNTAVKLAAVGDATPFRIYQSTGITGATCFKKQGDDHYVNTQADANKVKMLRGWTDTDGGSSCRFFAPDYYLLNYAADIPAGPANSLGTAQYFNTEGKFESFNNAIAAANADHFSATATANLEAIFADYASNATTNAATITDGGYYRLMNYQYKNYMTSGLDGTTNTLWGGLSATDAPGTAGTIVKITANGDNYELYAQGLKFGQITDASARLNLTGGLTSGLFTINNTGNKFIFMDVSTYASEHPTHRAIHQAADNQIVGWLASSDATKWYVIPATTLDLPLNTVDSKSYATTYLPFDVTLPADVKAYIVTEAEGGKATVSEVADIPANQGVVLVSETAAKATLTLGSASANCTDNILSGTNPRFTIEENAKSNYYIFGNGGDGVGFYHPNNTTLKENRAFLPASVVTVSGSVNGFKLDFGGVNTGIEATIQADEANATYYDLSGRRVIRPAKGIYVKNGRKVYVK